MLSQSLIYSTLFIVSSFEYYIREYLLPSIIVDDDNKNKMLPVLILDNHRSHWDPLDLLSADFEVLHTPPYSCVLNNPIESAWSLIKRSIQKKLLKQQTTHNKYDDWIDLVRAATCETVPLHHKSLFRSNFKYLLEFIDLAISDENLHQDMYAPRDDLQIHI